MSSYGYLLCIMTVEQREQWDHFISEQPNGHLLQSWGWGELKASQGWSPLRLALWDTQEQPHKMVAAAQVLCRGAAHMPLWVGHLAYIPEGPVLDWSQPGECETLFSQLHPLLRRRGALALRIEPNQCVGVSLVGALTRSIEPEQHGEASLKGARSVQIEAGHPQGVSLQLALTSMHFHPAQAIQPVRTILLDLTPDEDTLLARMKEKWRYNVRLAARKGVRVRVAQTVEDVQAWYVLLRTTSEREQFGIHMLDYYLRAWSIFSPRNQARLFLAEYNGQLLAGIFVGLLGKSALYLYGASSNEYRNLMPNYLLQWEAIRWAKQEGATCYDFWGIPETDDENEVMAGVYRFKSGWGGEIVRFPGCYEYVYRPFAMRLANRIIRS